MPSLSLRNFSCIKEGVLDLHPLTVLIGPQASGKSVLSKMLYFCAGLTQLQYSSAEDGDNIRLFKRTVAKEFTEWFPPSTWGKKAFEIKYEAGPLQFSFIRKQSTRKLYDEVEIDFSSFFEQQYSDLVANYRRFSRSKKEADDEFSISLMDRTWKVQLENTKFLRQTMGEEYVNYQLFIPAGRSFYTNLGKAFAVLEHGSQLDEVTKRFGRLAADLLDGRTRYFFGEKPSPRIREFIDDQKKGINSLLGGELKLSSNNRHFESDDGRKIPLSLLSSGQQEIVPLVLVLQHFVRILAADRDQGLSALYIEEPEAHLFPRAQASLTGLLAAVSNFTSPSGRMLITTHSPYVLSTLNALIKAFGVAEGATSSAVDEVKAIVPQRQWLAPGRVSAYAIEGGRLESIKDEGGLLDAEYLDSVSGYISDIFTELLGLEMING